MRESRSLVVARNFMVAGSIERARRLSKSLTIMTALREANQVGSLQPTTLVSYDADIERVFDSRDAAALGTEGMDDAALADAT